MAGIVDGMAFILRKLLFGCTYNTEHGKNSAAKGAGYRLRRAEPI
jgi:hypothetical protein